MFVVRLGAIITRLALVLSPAAHGVWAQEPALLPVAGQLPAGVNRQRLACLDEVLDQAVARHQVPGAVLLVGSQDQVIYARAVGQRAIEPAAEAMTRETLFDLASLTKPIATATSVMLLVERGRLRIDERLGAVLPEFDNQGKGAITVEQLLRHRSGLIADNPLKDYAEGPEVAWQRLAQLGLIAEPGSRFIYSDVNYIILGRIVEARSGLSLAEFFRTEVARPLGLTSTSFAPMEPAWVARTAPTARDGEQMLRGVVHDPRARALGGAAGHAGLFGTADDLARYAQMLLDGGRTAQGEQLLAPLTVRLMTSPGDEPAGQRRGLGWDIDTGFRSLRGSLLGPLGFGHTGFTGTSLWVDSETRTFVILLTSRLHPDSKGASPSGLRQEVATLVAAALTGSPLARVVDLTQASRTVPPTGPQIPAISPVACGIDVLAKREFADLRGKRVGLVTNHTGRTRDGRSTLDALFSAPGVTLVSLYSPEHGIRGVVDKEVPDDRDPATGLTVYSLYGKTRKPTQESLSGVEVLVYDIQDIGARFYTYISTLGLVLEAAAESKIPVLVLDRPNPIGGLAVSGPVRDDEFASFIAHHALPVRHGLTVGELATLFNKERSIGADLTVVRCEGWRRGDLFDRTGLLWVNPSPNMRSLTEALLYPGVGLLEATNLATGRGTDTPFERVGAPWIDPLVWSEALNRAGLPGVRFVPVQFTPSERQYAGQECGGVFIQIIDRSTFEPISLGIELAVSLRRLYPNEWQPEGLLKLLTDRAAYQAIFDGKPRGEVEETWISELKEFEKLRAAYLIYR